MSTHLELVLLDAETRLQNGEWNDGLRSMVQAIFVAATEPDHHLSNVELARWTNRLYDAGALPDEPTGRAA